MIRKRIGLSTVVLCLVGSGGIAIGALFGVSWSKAEVIPVVLVKPGLGGFSPVEGNLLGNTWSKSEVRPVILVKPGILGFIPREGSSIGNNWRKDEILPVMLVEPDSSSFVPLKMITSVVSISDSARDPSGALGSPIITDPELLAYIRSRGFDPHDPKVINALLAHGVYLGPQPEHGPGVIESRIDGEFTGWEGETIFRLQNGQIWQQASYAYMYRYSYSPKVLIYRSGSTYRMKVDGVDREITVRRLK